MRRMLTDADIAKLSVVEWALDEPEKTGSEFKKVRYGIYQISVGGYQGDAKLVALYKSQSAIEIGISSYNTDRTADPIISVDFNPDRTLRASGGMVCLKPICYFE